MNNQLKSAVLTKSAFTLLQRWRTAERCSREVLLGVKPEMFALRMCCGWSMGYRRTPERIAVRNAASDVADSRYRGVFSAALFLMLLTALVLFVAHATSELNG
jgi:hypothetical protein